MTLWWCWLMSKSTISVWVLVFLEKFNHFSVNFDMLQTTPSKMHKLEIDYTWWCNIISGSLVCSTNYYTRLKKTPCSSDMPGHVVVSAAPRGNHVTCHTRVLTSTQKSTLRLSDLFYSISLPWLLWADHVFFSFRINICHHSYGCTHYSPLKRWINKQTKGSVLINSAVD